MTPVLVLLAIGSVGGVALGLGIRKLGNPSPEVQARRWVWFWRVFVLFFALTAAIEAFELVVRLVSNRTP